MNLIVAVDNNWNIGNKGQLLCKNSIDMKFFRKTTLNKVVIMGRKTLESFKDSKPLPERINIVLTHERKNINGCIVVTSIDELLNRIEDYSSEIVFVIGGGQIYKELLPYCDTAYVTKMENVFEADTSFPDLDKSTEWKLVESSDIQQFEDIKFRFLVYKK